MPTADEQIDLAENAAEAQEWKWLPPVPTNEHGYWIYQCEKYGYVHRVPSPIPMTLSKQNELAVAMRTATEGTPELAELDATLRAWSKKQADNLLSGVNGISSKVDAEVEIATRAFWDTNDGPECCSGRIRRCKDDLYEVRAEVRAEVRSQEVGAMIEALSDRGWNCAQDLSEWEHETVPPPHTPAVLLFLCAEIIGVFIAQQHVEE